MSKLYLLLQVDQVPKSSFFVFSSLWGIIVIVSFILIIALIILLYVFIKYVSNLENKLENQSKQIEELKIEVRQLNHSKNINVRADNSSNSKKEPQQQKEKKINEEPPTKPIELEVIKQTAIPNENKDPSSLYFSSPYKENVFLISDGKELPSPKTLYEINDNSLKLYSNIDHDTMKIALNSIDIVIKWACNILNSKETHHSTIIMKEAGKVYKDGEDFKIKNKIKIEFQ
ncbi:MAG: hypothetical protein H0X63_06490 [Flavobacteriales bacterium]|nr:hypothetical protein [Flavobacteriales bacterium]